LDKLGSVCISRKTKSSCRQRSITLAAIFVVRHDIYVSFAQLVLDGTVTAAGNAPRFGPPGRRFIASSPTLVPPICSITSTRSVLPSHTHGRDFEPCIGAEPLQAPGRAHTCRLARIIAFVRQFLFHGLLIYRQLHPFAVQNNGAWSTASVLSRNARVEAVFPPSGVCKCSSGRSPRSPLCLGTGFSPRRAPPSARPAARVRHGGPARSRLRRKA
jgi:hypothetical protein